MKKLLGLPIALLLIIFDQYTKFWAKTNLENQDPVVIIKDIFELQYLENTGAAFGLFKNQLLFFVLMTVVALVVLLYFYWKAPSIPRFIPLYISMTLIFSGAIGNFIDRVRLNYVIDFFYFKWIDFPVFNVADCYVTVGTVLLALLIVFYYKEEDLDFYSNKHKKRNKENFGN